MAEHPRPAGTAGLLLAFALVVATVLLVLALASVEFQPTLNSDYLLAHVFAHGLGDPVHPVSGWKFGSTAFWFPDYVIYLPLYELCGNSGWSYPLYAVVIFLLLGATMAWSLAAAGVQKTWAAIAGFLALDVILLGQFIPGHAPWLWELGIPAYHGGNLVNGFALLAITLTVVRNGQWSRGYSISVVAWMTLGLVSNALLLFHWMVPLAFALGWQSRRTPALRAVSAGFMRRAALALGLALSLQAVFAATGWFLFYRLFREWPLPTLVWGSLTQFFTDFFAHGLFRSQWLFWTLAAAAALVAAHGLRTRKENPPNAATQVAFTAVLGGLALAWATPIAAIYWHDATSFRYLLNWLVAPAWLLTLWLCAKPSRTRWLAIATPAMVLLGAVLAIPRIEAAKLVFPNSPEALALRDYCAQRGLREGLADYWTGHSLNVAWDFNGPSLSNVRDKDFAYFWGNNVFTYFPAAVNQPGLRRPAPQFVLLRGLDREILTQWLGDGPLHIEKAGSYDIALLSAEQTRRAGELITAQAEDALQGRRAQWLNSQLPPAP